MELTLDTSVQYISGVGPKRAELLNKLEIFTCKDFLYHFPFRYNDFSIISPIASLQSGDMVTIKATVHTMKAFRTKTGKRIQQATVSDESKIMTISWFNQEYLMRIIKPEHVYHFSGEVSWFGNSLTLMSPVFEEENASGESLHTGRLVPVYHETEGVTSKWMRGKIRILLDALKESLFDTIPETTRRKHALIPLSQALEEIHYPTNKESLDKAKHRLMFEELFTLQVKSYLKKHDWETKSHASPLSCDASDLDRLITSLPFELTPDQKTALSDIIVDIGKKIPMNRLLLGDVGAGKTIVAAMASYISYRSGKSVLFMAPTQILASQHADTFKQLFTPLGIDIKLITGSSHDDIHMDEQTLFASDTPMIVIGTHALLHEDFTKQSIGLVIIDEQQKFGVEQRQLIKQHKTICVFPHILTMTATPIPRSIALTILGNLSISIIESMPKGRKPVKTWVVPKIKRNKAYEWIKKQIQTLGVQAFILCPFIDESESFESVKAATVEFEQLKSLMFPDMRLALLHGRMKGKEKTETLNSFRDKKYDILVSTPVVEVGVDIPYATIMMIEGAERFGLAQLHQLRGRVGRRDMESYCLLFTESEEEEIMTRLKAMERFHSGIELATFDLRLRGPGEVFGTRQHGIPNLKIASFFDMDLIEETKHAINELAKDDPDLISFPHLREMIKNDTIGN